MEELGIRPELWLRLCEGTVDEYIIPHATYAMMLKEKKVFMEFMTSLPTPMDYTSNP